MLRLDDLQHIPADSSVAVSGCIEGTQLLDGVLHLMAQVEPRAADELAMVQQNLEQSLGFRLREDLLASLGDVWQLYTSPREGGFISGWTLSTSVRDRDGLARVNDRLIGFLAGETGNRSPRIKTSELAGKEFYTLTIPDDDVPFAPSWCFDEQRFVFALFPQPVMAYLNRLPGAASIGDTPDCRRLFAAESPPCSLAHVDTRRISRGLPLVADRGPRTLR